MNVVRYETSTLDLLSVYCWYGYLLWIFFIILMFVWLKNYCYFYIICYVFLGCLRIVWQICNIYQLKNDLLLIEKNDYLVVGSSLYAVSAIFQPCNGDWEEWKKVEIITYIILYTQIVFFIQSCLLKQSSSSFFLISV